MLKLSYNSQLALWVVQEPYVVTVCDQLVSIPRGFTTDLASTPRLLWAIFPPFGAYLEAAVLHDALYRQKLFPRNKADLIFFHHMLHDGVSKPVAFTFYCVVRFFGIFKWNSV